MSKDPTPHVDEKTLGTHEPGKAHWPLDLELHPDAEEAKKQKKTVTPKPADKRSH